MARTRRRRRELFPPDRGLQARMLLAILLTPLAAVAGTAIVWWLLPTKFFVAIIAFSALGVGLSVRELRRSLQATPLEPGQEPELQVIVDRLCVVADLQRPEIVVDGDRQPNSWVVDAPRRPARLHVTRGLLELLEPAELEAVVAHELSHIAHSDATVMTVVGLPGDAMRKGVGSHFTGFLGLGAFAPMVVGMVAGVGSASLSRHRELTADAGSAALTGRPSALASALLKVSGELAKVPTKDLRAVAGFQVLNLVSMAEKERRPWRTHPSVEKRVAALERLERGMVAARAAPSAD